MQGGGIMDINFIINKINKDVNFEMVARVKGCEKNCAMLDRSGKVMNLRTESELEDYFHDCNILED